MQLSSQGDAVISVLGQFLTKRTKRTEDPPYRGSGQGRDGQGERQQPLFGEVGVGVGGVGLRAENTGAVPEELDPGFVGSQPSIAPGRNVFGCSGRILGPPVLTGFGSPAGFSQYLAW